MFRLAENARLLCGNGIVRYLKTAETRQFLKQAKNILRWGEGR